MARKVRNTGFESATARLTHLVRKKPYSVTAVARGIHLLYRRNKGAGSWVVKANGWTKAFAEADDHEASNGEHVLSFHEATERAKTLARGTDQNAGDAPITVEGALDYYKIDLEARGARAANAAHPRVHLTKVLLAKPVQLLDSKELKRWQLSLLDKVKPATVNRICKSLCAALEIAAKHDQQRIKNNDAWRIGLAGLPDASEARNVVLSDREVSAFVAEAYARDAGLGLLVNAIAVTGARPSQIIRLRVDDFRGDPVRPKVMMPKSGKGGGRNRMQKRTERYSVPITLDLAAKLRQAARGRPDDAPLLVRSGGAPWNDDPNKDYADDVREIVKAIGRDPDEVTLYALRHSSIVRSLLGGVPLRVVAATHNTSSDVIESNYSKYITEHSDDHARAALLDLEPPPRADNVIVLPGR